MLDRGYSFLTVKSIDAERRVITGLASSPVPDRVGDVIDPLGATFASELPLLLYHDTTRPVGIVKFDRPTKDGITFTASIPQIDTPGTLRDRVNEAWDSIKAGLIKGVSVGFRSLKDGVESLKSGGRKFSSLEILELSLVVVPAHQLATIHSIKTLAALDRAASGDGQAAVKSTSAGVSALVVKASKGAGTMAKTIHEQIGAFEATRQAKSARMTEIMTKAGEEGVTLDQPLSEEYDGLEVEVKQVDAHLVRLAALEKANIDQAVPVVGKTSDEASIARGGTIRVKDTLPQGIEFARYAMCLMAARGNTLQAVEIAKQRYPDQPRIHTVLKAAVAGGTTTDATWAGSLVDYTNFAGDFVEYLRPQTIIGKFGTNGIPSLRRVPFNVKIQGQTSGGEGYWVGQGKAKPLTKFDYAPITLTWAKVANIAVLTEELVRFSSPSAEALVRDGLAAALIARIDTDFIDPDKGVVANVSPASITNNVAPISTAGSSSADINVDIENVFASFIAANNTPVNGVWIMSNTIALRLALMRNALGQREFPDMTINGGTFMGMPVIASQYAVTGSPAAELVILVNASDIYLADDGQVVIDASREASLEMSDAPANSAASGTGASLVSMFQTNSVALRAERFINWAKRRSGAVAFLENVIWGQGGGSPA